MFTFSLSNDLELIKSVILAPNNILFNFDDTYPDPHSFYPVINKNIYYIKCMDNDVFQGFFFLIDKGNNVAEAHMAFLPIAYGKVSKIGKECLFWVWDNTQFSVLICPCISTNKLALSCIKHIGFKEYGFEENKWLSRGVWEHYILLKYNKP